MSLHIVQNSEIYPPSISGWTMEDLTGIDFEGQKVKDHDYKALMVRWQVLCQNVTSGWNHTKTWLCRTVDRKSFVFFAGIWHFPLLLALRDPSHRVRLLLLADLSGHQASKQSGHWSRRCHGNHITWSKHWNNWRCVVSHRVERRSDDGRRHRLFHRLLECLYNLQFLHAHWSSFPYFNFMTWLTAYM